MDRAGPGVKTLAVVFRIDLEYHCESLYLGSGYTAVVSRQLETIYRIISVLGMDSITELYCTVHAQDRYNPEIDVKYETYALLRTEHSHNLLRRYLRNRPPRRQLLRRLWLCSVCIVSENLKNRSNRPGTRRHTLTSPD